MQRQQPNKQTPEERYQNLLKNGVEKEFQTLGIGLPKDISDLITVLSPITDDKLKEDKLNCSKYYILLGKINEFKEQLVAESKELNTKLFDKIIKIYENILASDNDDVTVRNAFLSVYKKHDEKNVNAFLAKQTTVKQEAIGLLTQIRAMQHYGEGLKSNGKKKGEVVCELAGKLQKKAEEFFSQSDEKIAERLKKFKEDFLLELQSENKTLNQYRKNWSTILKNIGIALTGVGLLLIGAKLTVSSMKPKSDSIFSSLRKGRPLLFFAKDKTTSEDRINDVRRSLNSIGIGK